MTMTSTPCETCGVGFLDHSTAGGNIHPWKAPAGTGAAPEGGYQMPAAELLARRIVSSGISQLANKYAGGGWTLVQMQETEPEITVMVFELDHPITSVNGQYVRTVNRIRVEISAG